MRTQLPALDPLLPVLIALDNAAACYHRQTNVTALFGIVHLHFLLLFFDSFPGNV